jgi:hypothetical protein
MTRATASTRVTADRIGVRDLLQFEQLVADLSAGFVNLPIARIRAAAAPIAVAPGARPWTDDFNNLFEAMK